MKSQRGFTFIELMILVAIIGILFAVAIPKFKIMHENSKMRAEYGKDWKKYVPTPVPTPEEEGNLVVVKLTKDVKAGRGYDSTRDRLLLLIYEELVKLNEKECVCK